MDLIELDHKTGKLKINLHAGQQRAMVSVKQIVAVLSGTQGGKTSFGSPWLLAEMKRMGPGDYLVVTPTFPLFNRKLKDEVLRFFEQYLQLGEYKGAPQYIFEFSEEGERTVHGKLDPYKRTRIIFGHAQNSESLESMTVRAAWLDEAGQSKFRLASWNAIRRRLALSSGEMVDGIPGGRILVTTTPYNLGWLKRKLYDPYMAAPLLPNGEHDHPEIDLINFWSLHNPNFSRKEWDRAKADLPDWQFRMMYMGLFTQPAGLIYDSFDEVFHTVDRFPIPDSWQRFVGVDFGGVHTAAVFYAQEPKSGQLYLYRTYQAGGRTSEQHAHRINELAGAPITMAVGGAPSEDQWRLEFTTAGLSVLRPKISDVEVGINRVYAAHRKNEIMVFRDMEDYLEQKATYSRELDSEGNPTEEIADKNTFHLLDAERYIIGGRTRSGTNQPVERALPEAEPIIIRAGKYAKHQGPLKLPRQFRN